MISDLCNDDPVGDQERECPTLEALQPRQKSPETLQARACPPSP